MMAGILFYYIWIVFSLYLSYVYLTRVYNRNGNKKKRPLFIHFFCYVASFIPVVNIIAFCVLAYVLYEDVEYSGSEIRSFMFRKF